MAVYNFNEPKQKTSNVDYQKITGCVFVVVSIICIFCLITSFVPFARNFLLGLAGFFCYPFFITLMAVGFALIGHKKYIMPVKYGVLLGLSILFVLCIIQLILVKNQNLTFWQYLAKCYNQKFTAGGILVGIFTAPILYILNQLGAYIVFIALSVIFIALTVDYIHYLNKNQGLKKAIKIIEQKQEQPLLDVKNFEKDLKKAQTNSVLIEDKKQEKVKLTLDAKIEEESSDQSAKRKLGLLASSKQDVEDNSRYFKEDKSQSKKIENAREYILSRDNSYKLSDYSAKKLNQIQENITKLKSNDTAKNERYSSYLNNNLISKPKQTDSLVINTSFTPNSVVSNKPDVILPSKVIHEDSQVILTNNNYSTEKSFIGDVNKEISENNLKINNVLDDLKINNDFVDLNTNVINEQNLEKQDNNISNIDFSVTSNQKDNDIIINDINSIKNKNIDNSTLDVENFTNNVLASLKKSTEKELQATTVNYQSQSKMFPESEPVVEQIIPKKDINYIKPPIELLTTESMDLSLMNEDVVMKREELEMALDTFGIPAKVIGVVIGPAVTRYELEMPAGISIKRLLSLQEDIAYHLSSNGDIRIEAPIPGRRAVGIEVPNERIATVGLRDILLSREFMDSKAGLSIALGKDISGSIKTFSLVKIPHLLIAGTTGSGKSVCINTIILSLIYKYSPDEVKLILVDPKRVEFSMYNQLPHLLMPNVITDSEKALNALSWCVDEMEKRFITFANARVKNLEEYNTCEEVLEGRAEKLPYIIFIIDELADLLMTAKKEAEDYICRILQKARAAGIHMILATQRPSVDVVTGKIKANLNARICFALMTFADSKTVLDQGGADKLLGKGDMLFMSSDTGVPKRIQGCFVTTKEIDDVVNYVKDNNTEYDFDIKTEQAIINPPKNNVTTQIDADNAARDGFDALMPQVLKSVIESGHASISMIQRKFLVGFPRAARIIDQMEEAGYISPSDGSKSRSVYITMEEYEKLYSEEG